MPYASVTPTVGNQQVALFGLPDTTARALPGLMNNFVDNYFGGAEMVYAKAGGTIAMGSLCQLIVTVASGQSVYTMTGLANVANTGRAVYIAMVPFIVGQFGWFCQAGTVPVNCTASVAADTAIGITAAGQGGAVTAGKQILNARVALPATTTVAKTNCTANSGALKLSISSPDGWFIGAYLSGTGIAALTVVSDIDPSGTQVTLSVATTAAVNGTVTATYNNATIFYNIVHCNRPGAQGPIT